MSGATKIKMMLAQRGMTLTDLANMLDRKLPTICAKMKRDNFCEKDLMEIAELLGFNYEPVFTDKETGKQI